MPFALSVVPESSGDLSLAFQPPGGESTRCELLFTRRSDKREHRVACSRDGDQLVARLALVPLLLEREARWDVRVCELCRGGASSETLLRGDRLVRNQDRHFLVWSTASHDLSCYLTESAQSLALYIAPSKRHAGVVEAENARERYAHHLAEAPLDDKLVFFESFLGKAYAGNPRYLYEALLRLRPDLRCVWSYDGNDAIPGNPQVVTRRSPDYYRLLAQARYRVNNVIFSVHGKKPETCYLQTWHGTPLKRIAFDIDNPQVDARDNFYKESRDWSLLLSENGYSTTIFRRAFRYDGEVLEAGYPLTDPLVQPCSDRADRLKTLGLPPQARVILYAPTWRDHKPVGDWQYGLDLHLDLGAVARRLPIDHFLLIKAHHLVAERIDRSSLPSNVRDVSHLGDITELCRVADCLVTDYSSVFFDFAVTGRPILFYCYDLALYEKALRGFYLDMQSDLPGPVVQDSEQLLDLLADLPAVSQRYANRYAHFRERFCALNDGRAAERVVERVFGAIK
ncbi:CDP-glycerol glycerophosphotransferase family protein [Pseudomonas stutzeri]|uniref:CDP-glycerol glycerophosphotransferase family protein n=1 Tax=Stutzerimonas stutzeri TaxID=316 RepID=UPI00210BDACB|nr:CDP-glycerol glycerophosphotransferase family protein [Stutzerimonas stutzeri]MCQ4310755.1 CDP-glycerol glycerophosphotransferase family protein [Stutzerimonas stutzeri]